MIALCALFSSSCSAANAQSWQCHAREGTFDTHDIAVAQNITQVTGEMMIRKANGLSQWNPTAKVAFTDLNSGGPECHCNGIIATWHPEYPDSFEVKLAVDGKNESLGFVPYDKPVKFKLTFAWNGALKLEVGTQVATGMAPTPIRNNLELSCSTADVDLTSPSFLRLRPLRNDARLPRGNNGARRISSAIADRPPRRGDGGPKGIRQRPDG